MIAAADICCFSCGATSGLRARKDKETGKPVWCCKKPACFGKTVMLPPPPRSQAAQPRQSVEKEK